MVWWTGQALNLQFRNPRRCEFRRVPLHHPPQASTHYRQVGRRVLPTFRSVSLSRRHVCCGKSPSVPAPIPVSTWPPKSSVCAAGSTISMRPIASHAVRKISDTSNRQLVLCAAQELEARTPALKGMAPRHGAVRGDWAVLEVVSNKSNPDDRDDWGAIEDRASYCGCLRP